MNIKPFSLYVKELGKKEFSIRYDISERAAESYIREQRSPRDSTRLRIIALSNGEITSDMFLSKKKDLTWKDE